MAKHPDKQTRPEEGEGIFGGFSSPNYTQVPDQLLDNLLPDLSEAELKVLLYIVRRTFGFKKESDTISLRQLSNGITTKDGRQLDRGTGLSKSGVTKALLSLRKRGILIRFKNSDSVRGSTPTTYRLRMMDEPLDIQDEVPDIGDYPDPLPLSTTAAPPVYAGRHPLSSHVTTRVHAESQGLYTDVDTQETVTQETESRNSEIESSIGKPRRINYSETRMTLQPYLEDFAREFADQAKLPSTLTRAVNVCERSGLEVDEFIDVMLAARSKTKEYSGSIKTEMVGEGWSQKRPRIAYFFAILEQMVGLRPERQTG